MSVMSIDVSQVAELVDSVGYPVMLEEYEAVPLVYPELGEVEPSSALASTDYGTKGTVIAGPGRHRKRQDGQDFDHTTLNSAYTWYLRADQYGIALTIPARLRRSADNMGKIGSMIAAFARAEGESARIEKEDFIADMFQKGTLTAGDADFFDGSFPNNADPNPAFIYDGLPWFDGAHTLTESSTTLSNINTSLALSAANVQTVLTTMTSTNAVDERGERVTIRPDYLMVPPGLAFTAGVILGTVQAPGSANNDINPLRGLLKPIVNRALDDAASASSWWVGQSRRGLKIADSGPPALMLWEERNGDITVKSEYIFGAAVTNWRYHYCANKADS